MADREEEQCAKCGNTMTAEDMVDVDFENYPAGTFPFGTCDDWGTIHRACDTEPE